MAFSDDPLWAARVRVARAGEKLRELRTEIEKFDLSQQERVSYDFDTDTKEVAFTCAPLDPPPDVIWLLLSEATHHLRSALDYVVFQLSLHRHGSEVSGTQFPIEDTEEGFQGRRKTYLRALSDAQVDVIKRLQPCEGCSWTRRLRDLCNPDKHRRPIVVAHLSHGGTQVSAGAPGEFEKRVGGRVYRTHGPEGEPMDVHVAYVRGTFIEFVDGTSVVDTVEQLIVHVGNTLDTFAPEF